MPHCKNTQTIREIAKCFEKNTEKAMNDIANTIKALNSIIASISGAKYSRTFKCWHTERVVKFDGMEVKLIFSNYFDTDTDTIFEKCINDNEKFNKFINIAAFREVA